MRFAFLRHCNKNVPPDCVKDEKIPADNVFLKAIQNGTMPVGLDYTQWASNTNTWCNDCNELGYQNAIQWKDAFLKYFGPTNQNLLLMAAAYKSTLHPNCSGSRRMVENLWPYSLAIQQPILALFCDTDLTAASQYLYSIWQKDGPSGQIDMITCWEHKHIPPLVDDFMAMFPNGTVIPKYPKKWDGDDFNSLWVFTISPGSPPTMTFELTSRTGILGLPPPSDASSGSCIIL